MLGQPPSARVSARDVKIGKFDILATYTYAQVLLDGSSDEVAKEWGIVAVIVGSHTRNGYVRDHRAEKDPRSGRKRRRSQSGPSTARWRTSWAHLLKGVPARDEEAR